jgi:hypothetical protein
MSRAKEINLTSSPEPTSHEIVRGVKSATYICSNSRWPKRLAVAGLILLLIALATAVYVRTHPLVFNESFWGHDHCIAQVGMALRIWANDHGGKYPTHTNGYCDALLLAWNEINSPSLMTGPGYSGEPFRKAHDTETHLPESEGGRVYIQGLSEDMDASIALVFDKLPTPGGDHTHFLARCSAPLGREVSFVDGSHRFVREENWPGFTQEQIERLVRVGVTRSEAERLYSEIPRSRTK